MRSLPHFLFIALFPLLARGEPLNVLFISADDLRVEPLALTPNLDRLAKQIRVFTNANCQQAICTHRPPSEYPANLGSRHTFSPNHSRCRHPATAL